MKTVRMLFLALVVCGVILAQGVAHAGHLTIAIMQDEPGSAKKYKPLQTYLEGKGISFNFVAASNYSAAADMFASGKADAMFSGSAIAGIFIIKDLATPLLRPVSSDGISTYSAVVIAPRDSPKFSGNADYFKGKRVILTPLASSGEIYFRSIPNIKSAGATVQRAASHGAALDALSGGFSDVAIVKNRVWEHQKTKYPKLALVGQDSEENPDNTLIVSRKADTQTVAKVQTALLALKGDKSPQAEAVRKEMNIQGYVKTTKADFKHTLELFHRAGVDRSFTFEFR